MGNPQLTTPPMSKTEMLVRKPAVEVLEAIVNPEITTQFWYTHGSARLEMGKQVRWDWEMYDVSVDVTPRLIEPRTRCHRMGRYNGPTRSNGSSFRTTMTRRS